ncbi:PAS domain-containing protein [Pelagibius litoralis]|uniref:PAS domain-containing protein n=1 Tax=Pelagibius litoralis TaxID=374515 RepID=A0A967EWN2_9PROT|nr:PAS domain-containing protein [Pelagibius litoralis]NIA67518.1 PAS domain-containing protein [Pelagibius litoralis]
MSTLPRWREAADRAKNYLASAEAAQLLETWTAAGSTTQPPRRDEMRPENFPALLPDLWLMDFEPESKQLRYRLEGEHIRARYDQSLVGRDLVDTIAPEALERVRRYFLACVEQPAICLVIGRLYHEWNQPGYGERMLLPLFSEAGSPSGLIGITICKETFADRKLAEERAKRLTCILPLDGEEPYEQNWPG